MAKVHDRMPVVVARSQLDKWLTGDPTVALNVLSPAPTGMLVATDVSKYVNIIKHDDLACVARRSDSGQGSLF